MTVDNATAGTSYATAYLNHVASIPACQLWDVNYGGRITYHEQVEFYRSGTIAVEGYRFRAPAHEMYGRFTTASGGNVPWLTISKRGNEGFACLLGNSMCTLDFYDTSVSY